MSIKALIGCEESQTICKAFRRLGVEAYSNDLLDCSGGHPEWHLKMDVFEAIKLKQWDLFIVHPECQRLTVAANKYYKPEYAEQFPNIHEERKKAIDFFKKLTKVDIPYKAIENPIGIMSSKYRKPDQIIQPYQFGDSERKATCLWLYNLPQLMFTKVVQPEIITLSSGRTDSKLHYETFRLPLEERRKARSKTFEGIAQAIAIQWTLYILYRKLSFCSRDNISKIIPYLQNKLN